MPNLKIRLEHANEYLFLPDVSSLTDICTSAKATFHLENEDFNIMWIDTDGSYIIINSQKDFENVYNFMPYRNRYECIVRLRHKQPMGPQEKTSTSPHATTESSMTPKSADTSTSSSANNFQGSSDQPKEDISLHPPPQPTTTVTSSTQLDSCALNLDFYRRMENLFQEITENTSNISRIMGGQQQQQQQQCHKSVGTSSYLTDFASHVDSHATQQTPSVSCRECKKLYTGHPWVCNQCCCQSKPSNMVDMKKKKNHGVKHDNIICDHCNSIITGIRFKCGNCSNFDLCESCESIPAVHNQDHVFLKIRRPLTSATYIARTLLPTFNYDFKQTDCTVHQKPQTNTEHEFSPITTAATTTTTTTASMTTDNAIPKPNNALAATLVDHTNISDGHLVTASHSFLKLWRIKNNGTTRWPAGCTLKHTNGNVQPTKLRYQDDIKLLEILPGEEVNVSLYLSAPTTPGYYTGHFRMTTPRGTYFGDPLSCSINVLLPSQRSEATTSSSDVALDVMGITDATVLATGNLSSSACTSPSSVTTVPSVNTSIHQKNNNDEDDHCGSQHQSSRGTCTSTISTATQTVQPSYRTSSSPQSSPTDYVFVGMDSMDQMTRPSPSFHHDPPNEKPPINVDQADMKALLKVLNKQQKISEEEFPYSQQLAEIHEMGIKFLDEEAKKLLIEHDGNMLLIWPKLMQYCYPALP